MRRHLILAVLIVPMTACGSEWATVEPAAVETTAGEVRNGSRDFATNDPRFFALVSEQGSLGSSTAIRYPRCLLTAAHVTASRALQGVEPLANGSRPYQNAARNRTYPDWESPWTDLQVVWLENKIGAVFISEYAPEVMNPGPYVLPRPSALIWGYGQNATGAGHGVRRYGLVRINSLIRGDLRTPPRKGAYFHVRPKTDASTPQMACPGDSGGPLYKSGTVWGVASEASGTGGCSTFDRARYTALDLSAPEGEVSNYDWTDEAIESICMKSLFVSIEGEGHVGGTIAPAQRVPSDTEERDGDVDCVDSPNEGETGFGDCREDFHLGQRMTITATAGTGWEFVRWGDRFFNGDYCPCLGSTDPVCVVQESEMGLYDATRSHDASYCEAQFKPEAPPTPAPETPNGEPLP